ncbi:hypothetical protein [Eubacterium aggregans]|uniref:hypothetical protein n=1 Tax=Eubacterium aggregans TaxID=81409 RepID=UPI003F3F3472
MCYNNSKLGEGYKDLTREGLGMWLVVLAGNIFIYGMCAVYMNERMTPRLGKKATGIIWLFLAIGTFFIGQS